MKAWRSSAYSWRLIILVVADSVKSVAVEVTAKVLSKIAKPLGL
jgi:hypothetical protein